MHIIDLTKLVENFLVSEVFGLVKSVFVVVVLTHTVV